MTADAGPGVETAEEFAEERRREDLYAIEYVLRCERPDVLTHLVFLASRPVELLVEACGRRFALDWDDLRGFRVDELGASPGAGARLVAFETTADRALVRLLALVGAAPPGA